MEITLLRFFALMRITQVAAWTPSSVHCSFRLEMGRASTSQISMASGNNDMIEFDSLIDMDVVVYTRKEANTLELGAMQEDGTLAPLSAWTEEASFGNSVEFLVDEEDRFPGLQANDIEIRQLISEDMLSYGSRQVGGGKGPGNPHGEESELLYYVDKSVFEESQETINIVIKPDLEITW